MARGLAGLRVTAQPGAGHRMPFGNCPEQERAPGRACTGAFGREGGTLIFIWTPLTDR